MQFFDFLMYKVIGTETYMREIQKWSESYKLIVEKIPKKLALNPSTGDPLGYPFLREKRIRGKRIYYLVYNDLKLVLLVASSEKKNQQATIDHIKQHLGEFRIIAENITKQEL